MKNWKDKIAKELGKNAVKYVYSHADFVTQPSLSIMFYEEAHYAAAIKDKNALEKLFPGVVLKCSVFPRP